MTSAKDQAGNSTRSREELREQLIESAGELLRGQGVGEFSTTRVAEACDTSTQMIYTLFGGKSALLKAVYETKAEELAERFRAIDTEDPVEYFYDMGMVYRDFMLEHAALYDAVFSLEALENYDGRGKLIERVETFKCFEAVIEDLIEADLLPAETDPAKLTDQLWASVNGIIRATILDYYPDEETAMDHYIETAFSILRGQANKDSPLST